MSNPANRLRKKEMDKIYYKKNKDKVKAKNKEYVLSHRLHLNAYKNSWRMSDPLRKKHHLAYNKLWRDTHKDLRTAYHEDRKRNIVIIDIVNKEILMDRFNYSCAYCGNKLKNDKTTHIDHLIPAARAKMLGKKTEHSYNNCVPSCRTCNLRKNIKLPLEFIWENTIEVV